mmetsp:Transcript_13944/g.20611  ORF Transcript_13944/g.20611 Transcript_13944/m.20611 type:complete len:92 (+) Transcript_13944:204-479(+)
MIIWRLSLFVYRSKKVPLYIVLVQSNQPNSYQRFLWPMFSHTILEVHCMDSFLSVKEFHVINEHFSSPTSEVARHFNTEMLSNLWCEYKKC